MQDSYYNHSIQNKNSFEEYNQTENQFFFESIDKYIDNYNIISDDYPPVPSTNNNGNSNGGVSDNNILYPSFLSSLSNTPKKTPNGLSKYLTSNIAIPSLPISQPIESESVNSQVVPTCSSNNNNNNSNNSNNLNSSSDFIIPTYSSTINTVSTNENDTIQQCNNSNTSQKNIIFNETNNENCNTLNNTSNIPINYNNKNQTINYGNSISTIKKEKKKKNKQSNSENNNNNNNSNCNSNSTNINHNNNINNFNYPANNINHQPQNNTYYNTQSYHNSPNYNHISIQEQEKMQLTSNCFNLIQYCNQLSYITKQAYNNPFVVPEELEALSTLGNYIQYEISSVKSQLMKRPLKDSKLYQTSTSALISSPRCQYEQSSQQHQPPQQSILVPNSYSNSPAPSTSGYYSPLPDSNQHTSNSSSSVFSSAVSSPFPTTSNNSPNIPPNKVVKKNQVKSFKQSTTYINLTENMIRAQTKKSKKSSNRVCLNCKTSDTPEWRRGPQGAKTLCNACGIRYRIQQQQQLPNSQNNINIDEYNNSCISNHPIIEQSQQQFYNNNNNYDDQSIKC